MQKSIFTTLSIFFFTFQFVASSQAQSLGGLYQGATNAISHKGLKSALSDQDVAAGLSEALLNGSKKAAEKLSATDGFFGNQAIKILMPPDAVKAESKLRAMGFGAQVDKTILSMNRAAEDASQKAAPIFSNAISTMSFTDAIGILRGSDTAATGYLRQKTTPDLTIAFTPVIKESLDKVDATKYWSELVNIYNKIPFVKKMNPDITDYVTGKALGGLFTQVALEEKTIRKDPVAQTSDLLKKVFGNK